MNKTFFSSSILFLAMTSLSFSQETNNSTTMTDGLTMTDGTFYASYSIQGMTYNAQTQSYEMPPSGGGSGSGDNSPTPTPTPAPSGYYNAEEGVYYIDGEPQWGLDSTGSGWGNNGNIWINGTDTGGLTGWVPNDGAYYIAGQWTPLDSNGDGVMGGRIYSAGVDSGAFTGWDPNSGIYYMAGSGTTLDSSGNGWTDGSTYENGTVISRDWDNLNQNIIGTPTKGTGWAVSNGGNWPSSIDLASFSGPGDYIGLSGGGSNSGDGVYQGYDYTITLGKTQTGEVYLKSVAYTHFVNGTSSYTFDENLQVVSQKGTGVDIFWAADWGGSGWSIIPNGSGQAISHTPRDPTPYGQ